MSKLRIVLDTNVLLVSISSRSTTHWIFQKLLQEEFDLFITNEILLEYEEIVAEKYNSNVAKDVVRTLLKLPNVHHQTIYYHWNLISDDVDDNKFVDCAVSANVDYFISHDKHFNILQQVAFPKVEVLRIPEFKALFFPDDPEI
jgi:putative PIN family toxin of toxin-antitoxin system